MAKRTEQDDVFRFLLGADKDELNSQWRAVGDELTEVERELAELKSRHERLEAKRDLLLSVAKFRDTEKLALAESPDSSDESDRSVADVVIEILNAEPGHIWDAARLQDALRNAA